MIWWAILWLDVVLYSKPFVSLLCSGLVHDVKHPGIPNFCLAKESEALNEKYKGKALAEQNSFDVSWKVLMGAEYSELRSCLYITPSDLIRFRQTIIKTVLATEIFDPENVQQQRDRWHQAFVLPLMSADSDGRKAYAAIELLIQASDVAHLTQGWSTYNKWNKKLFKEMALAYQAGRFPNDPSVGWFEGELKFFDSHVIPLCQRMCDCGLFGSIGDDYLKHAQSNRKQWQLKGKDMVESMKNSTTAATRKSVKKDLSRSLTPPVASISADPAEV